MTMPDVVLAFDERGRAHHFSRASYDALIGVGLIREDHAGRPTFEGATLDFRRFPELAVCDFCHARPVTWSAEATTFQSELLPCTSVAGWAACETCGLAIQRGDRATLRVRVRAFVRDEAPSGLQRAALGVVADEMLTKFWQHFISIDRYHTPYAEEQA